MKLNRRGFLIGSASAALCAGAVPETGKAGGKDATGRVPPPPPGSGSAEALLRKCTACNLCVSRCPSHVLKAAGLEYGLAGVMMPRMDFARGYCRPDCNECGKVCPSGAIRPFDLSEKKRMRQAAAIYVKDDCLVLKEKFACGNCATHCPYKAIAMEKAADGRAYPKLDPAKCVGCGACEYHCPSKAIRVVGRPKEEVRA